MTALFGAPQPAPSAAPAVAAPVVVPAPSSAAVEPAAAKLQATFSESALPPGTDVPAGHGLLELQVPDGTPIRVDGEYLGMGPARRVALMPGEHQLLLGEGPPQSVTIKAGQRNLGVVGGAAGGPAGSP
jgi:hypothetical protein